MLKAMCTLSSLLTRNTADQEAIRNLPDHRNATIPGRDGYRMCPPLDLTAHMLDAEWRTLHNDWSK
eukprot:8464989-Pyramimonas_sp.AAC.1